MGGFNGRKEHKQSEWGGGKLGLEISYAEVVKRQKNRDRKLVRMELSRRRGPGNFGATLAKVWGLKGNLGLARPEKNRVLLEFELLGEAIRVMSSGKRSFGLPLSLWNPTILRRVGEECGGFIAMDPRTEKLQELQWARILIRTDGEDLPSVLEIAVEEKVYSLVLWWELKPALRKAQENRREAKESTRGEVRVMVFHALTQEWRRSWKAHGSRRYSCQKKGWGFRREGWAGCLPNGLKEDRGPVQSWTPSDEGVFVGPPLSNSESNTEEEILKNWETEDLRKRNMKILHSVTDSTLVEEALRYGSVPLLRGERVSGSSHLIPFIFYRAPEGSIMIVQGMLGWSLNLRFPCVSYLEKDQRRIFKNVENGTVWVFTGVYGPFTKEERECLWEEIGAIRGLWEDPWCVGGDFNITLFQRERSRQGRITSAMRRFAQIADELGLMDIPLQGGVFTWSGGPNNQSWARLDRFLVNTSWLDQFSSVLQSRLSRPLSDHFPVLLEGGGLRRGPSPFKLRTCGLRLRASKI
ncbi:hypothetical protein CK203_043797 [Vitis vinifera]|uniref:Endonuclease/exonuclease/phosphatase domain-containing protein n=1 Tax=Vitis vinifera TaxID=29760 RepID=A0A438HW93_VITVI|nr:hypothetical protein CK203_043797 [Vitis vinifera]